MRRGSHLVAIAMIVGCADPGSDGAPDAAPAIDAVGPDAPAPDAAAPAAPAPDAAAPDAMAPDAMAPDAPAIDAAAPDAPAIDAAAPDAGPIDATPIDAPVAVGTCALDPCDPRAICSDTSGGATCACGPGFTGDGFICDDVDECAAGPCDVDERCENTPGDHRCVPLTIDECAEGTDTCSPNATCADTAQGYTCTCEVGTTGDGQVCQRAYDWFGVGTAHGCALVGTALRCWGDNTYVQLGFSTSPALDAPRPGAVPGAWRQADAEASTTCGVFTDGTWRCTGRLYWYTMLLQVGDDTDWLAAAAGDYHTCAIRSDRTLWCAGYNGYGQLGDGTTSSQIATAPVMVPGGDWSQVEVGGNQTCAIDGDGGLWCWGHNLWGQLGVGDNANRALPTRVGADTWRDVSLGPTWTCGLRTDGAVLCWGDNSERQLGTGQATPPILYGEYAPVAIAAAGPFVALDVGDRHACALDTDGALWCWGESRHGNFLAEEDVRYPVPVELVAAGAAWTGVGVGSRVTCARRADGTIHCWGEDARGQLGGDRGGGRDRPSAVAPGTSWLAVDARGGHACAVRRDGSLWCWGDNGDGQLGDGSRVPRDAPLRVGSADDWIGVATGLGHTCALRRPDRLVCWGRRYGDAPVAIPGAWRAVSASSSRDCALSADRTLWCWAPAATPAPAPVLSAVESFQAGHVHACAVQAGGVLHCWGSNASGELADGTYTSRTAPAPVTGTVRFRRVGVEHNSTVAIDEAAVLRGAGHRFASTVLVDAGAGAAWSSIVAGNYHACGVREDRRITCLAAAAARGGGEHPGAWARVSTGMGDFSCALDATGAAFCWGDPAQGGIGDGDAWRSTITPVAD